MSILILAVTVILFTAGRFTFFGLRAKFAAKKNNAYNQHPPNPSRKILCVGDSIAAGVGAKEPLNSIVGNIGKDFPTAEIINHSKSGAGISKLLKYLKTENLENYDLIFVIIGGMDIIQLKSLAKFKKNLQELILLLSKHSKKIIFLPPTNTGSLPLYYFPITQFLSRRSHKMQKIFQKICQDNQNCFTINADFSDLLKDKKTYFSADLSHPNDAGYTLWYQKIKKYLI